jgi:protein-tyrosine phosphatase
MGLFDFFSKKNTTPLIQDFSCIGTDMHSHLIPGIDDGAKNIAESINLISELKNLGYSKIITTPHIMSDYYKNTPEIIHHGLDLVRADIEKFGLNIHIEAAAEYYIDYDFQQKIGREEFMTMGEKYMLFEFSYFSPPQEMFQIIFDLQSLGYKTILAHPERYTYWHNNPSVFEDFKNRSVYLQLNLLSLAGEYTLPVKKIAEKLIQMDMYDFAATDLHNSHQIDSLKTVLLNKHFASLIESGRLQNRNM